MYIYIQYKNSSQSIITIYFIPACLQELYISIEKMRPTLFRMASELKQDEEGMAEILQTNETVIRVMDRYKSIFGEPTPKTNGTSATTMAGSTTTAAGGGDGTSTSASGAAALGCVAEGGASSKQDDVLIDLLGLDLGPSPTVASGGNLSSGSGASIGGGSGSGANLGSLLDDLGSLGESVEMMHIFPIYVYVQYVCLLCVFVLLYHTCTCAFWKIINVHV